MVVSLKGSLRKKNSTWYSHEHYLLFRVKASKPVVGLVEDEEQQGEKEIVLQRRTKTQLTSAAGNARCSSPRLNLAGINDLQYRIETFQSSYEKISWNLD